MQLGWIDFSKEDRQKAFDVINLLSEQGAVDELGIGVIRDAFANYFFPGTSTIQTRAKYFLIVPYMLREAVDGRYGKDANRVLRAIDSAEKDCGIRLLEADPKAEGVIGSRVLPKGWVARKPSDIYWNGIRTFGIFCDYGLSIPEYVSLAVKLKEQKSVSRLGNRNDDAEENDKDDSDAGDIGNIRFWNLPIYHDDWRDNLTIELTQEEAFYLDKQIQKSTKGSLLEYVLKNRIDLNEYDDFASLTAELSEKVGEKLAYMMKLACDFNNLVYMARVRYNVMLSEDENTYANDEWSRLLPDIRHNATVDLDAVFGEFQLINPRAKSFLCGIQNPIGMLNALQKVSDKIVLFCEAGQIKVPTKPTALSILLEKMVVEVALPKDRQLGRYPSFHPKTWVLAYVNADGDKKYRFVVMSRNLTFDRSWDISFAMDSSKNVRQKKKTQPICDFLDYLVMNVHNTSNNAGKKRNLIRGLCADIKDVSFSLDSKIFGEDFEVLPLGIGKNAYRMQEDILFCKERGNANSTFNELVVMSPFLSESVIADFNLTDRALSDCKRTLVTRRSELGKLKASDVDNFTIYALKDEIIDGEEEISDELADKKKQDIHAKIYLRRKYSDVDLYLGSMNASYSAINKNVEMMLWLGTKNMYLNGDKFLEDIFCGPVGDAKNPFEQVTVADAVLETESDNRNLLEQKIKDLCRVKRQAVISEDNENAGKYKIEVEFSGIESDSEVTVSPFNSKQEQTLSEHIEFSELEILQLSEFYEITARSGDDTIRRIIMIPTSGFPDDRESAAVNSVVKDRASFVEYIAFVLGDDYVASMLEGKQMGESGFFANSSDAMPALYEKMLKTSVEGPERIKDIEGCY